MRDEFGDEPAKSKTRAELQDDLRKYGITPRPGFDPSGPNLPEYRNYLDDPKEKAKARRLENAEYADKRQPKSDLIRQAELDKMKEISNKSKSSGGGGGGGAGIPKVGPKKPLDMKAGGKVSSKLKSAGFYDKGKTTSERKKIVSKVTTKPQRLGIVEKLFSAKKMKAGGMASKRADGIAIKGKTRA